MLFVVGIVCTVGDRKVKREVETKSFAKLPTLLRMPRQSKKPLASIKKELPKVTLKAKVGMTSEGKTLRAMLPKTITKRVKREPKEPHMTELHKHRYNIRMILQYSNATPIRAHYAGTGFACGFCKEFFHKAADLKAHTIEKHNKDRVKFMQTKSLSKFIVKLDITGLDCSICKAELNTVEELIEHLNKTHEKTLYTDIKNQIVCFKLAGDAIKCMFCPIEYTTFKPLLEHMNQHYRNFICEVCAAGFVSNGMLARHATVHTVGEYKCRSCEKVFETQNKVRQHEKFHTGFRFKCFQCGEKFESVKVKKDHMKSVHGAKYEFKCPTCDRQFTNKVTLWAHKRRDHLLERRFECEHCDMRFFSKAERDNHMVTHTDVREFLCEICCKAFRLKKTLRQHMRTHSNDKSSRSITVNAPVNERPPAVEPRTFFF